MAVSGAAVLAKLPGRGQIPTTQVLPAVLEREPRRTPPAIDGGDAPDPEPDVVHDLVLAGGRVADATFDALREHLTDEEILELTYITCMYEMHAIMSKALRTEFDDRDDPIVEIAGDEASLAVDVGAAISREDV